ncbi:MAG: hypothetical protein ACI9OJ_004493, partial [Myxococcota bacterium]
MDLTRYLLPLLVVSLLPASAVARKNCGKLTVFQPTMTPKRMPTWSSLELAFGGSLKSSAVSEEVAKAWVCARAVEASSRCGDVFIVVDNYSELHVVGTHAAGGFWLLKGIGVAEGGTE